jgi:hypothetical protein
LLCCIHFVSANDWLSIDFINNFFFSLSIYSRDALIIDEENHDHEEEFYYTEIEMNDLSGLNKPGIQFRSVEPLSPTTTPESPSSTSSNLSPTFAGPLIFFRSSQVPNPTTANLEMIRPPHEDHEYQKQIPNGKKNGTVTIEPIKKSVISSPINIPGSSLAHPQSTHARTRSELIISSIQTPVITKNPSPLNLSSPKASPFNGNKIMRLSKSGHGTTLLQSSLKCSTTSPTRRSRGETRKCRKVYGMENRESWCTQCKWKKACTRFVD